MYSDFFASYCPPCKSSFGLWRAPVDFVLNFFTAFILYNCIFHFSNIKYPLPSYIYFSSPVNIQDITVMSWILTRVSLTVYVYQSCFDVNPDIYFICKMPSCCLFLLIFCWLRHSIITQFTM